MPTRPEEVKDLVGLITYIREHADRILIKIKSEGTIATALLSDLPPAVRSEAEFGFLKNKTVPFRILTKEEAQEITAEHLIEDAPKTEEALQVPTAIQPA
jgi:hypothetical protein